MGDEQIELLLLNPMKKSIGKVVEVHKTWLSQKEAADFMGMSSKNYWERLRNDALVTFSRIPGSNQYHYELRSLERLLEKNVIVKQQF